MCYWITRFLCVVLSSLFFPVKVRGSENLPRRGGYLIASNHVSHLDPIVIAVGTHRLQKFLGKDSLFKNKFFGFYMRSLGVISIRRNAADFRALRQAIRTLKEGVPLVVFPEGTRRASEGEKKIQAGVGLLATKANVPVIPTSVQGTERILPAGAKFFKCFRPVITLTFGKAIHFSQEDAYREIAKQIVRGIGTLP